MSSTQVYHDPSFMIEVWTLFGVGMAVLLARFMVRSRTVGIRQFAGDDYMSLVVLACYIADAITVSITYHVGSNVDFSEDEVNRLTNTQLERVEYGSRMQLLAWYTYTTLIWALKACMLFFFQRLTFGLSQEKFVKALGVVCGLTYLAVFLTISVSCHPIQLNWQVKPKPPERCEVRIQNVYVCTILNVTTDAALLAVPLPMLWRLRIPIRKKITLALLLSSGIFIIAAAIIRIIMTLKGPPSALTVNRWGVRETIAGIVAVNAPMLKPLTMGSFYKRGFKLSGQTQPVVRLNRERSDNSKQSSDATTKSKVGSSISWAHRKPEALQMVQHHGSRIGSRANIGLPPHRPPPQILTPFTADLRDIDRIDTHLGEESSGTLQDRSFERGDYFTSIDIIERGPGPPPVPIEIIDAQQLYIPPTPGSLVRHESSHQPTGRRWAEIRWARFGRRRHDLG